MPLILRELHALVLLLLILLLLVLLILLLLVLLVSPYLFFTLFRQLPLLFLESLLLHVFFFFQILRNENIHKEGLLFQILGGLHEGLLAAVAIKLRFNFRRHMFECRGGSGLRVGRHEIILLAKVFAVIVFGSSRPQTFDTSKGR